MLFLPSLLCSFHCVLSLARCLSLFLVLAKTISHLLLFARAQRHSASSLGMARTSSLVKHFFSSSKEFWQASVHLNFQSFFRRLLRGDPKDWDEGNWSALSSSKTSRFLWNLFFQGESLFPFTMLQLKLNRVGSFSINPDFVFHFFGPCS